MTWPFSGKMPVRIVRHWDVFYSTGLSGTQSASDRPCVLGGITIVGGTMGNLVIRDATGASGGGGVIAQIATPETGRYLQYNVKTNYGLAVYASAATNFTITYLK